MYIYIYNNYYPYSHKNINWHFLKNINIVRVSKINAVAHAQLTFQMWTLLKKYLYHHKSQYSKTWDCKCLALIAQMVRAFGMNPKVGGSSPSQVETFSVSQTFTTSVRVSKMNAVAHAQLRFEILTLLKIYICIYLHHKEKLFSMLSKLQIDSIINIHSNDAKVLIKFIKIWCKHSGYYNLFWRKTVSVVYLVKAIIIQHVYKNNTPWYNY